VPTPVRPRPRPPGGLLTFKEAGDYVGCSSWTVRGWADSGKLPVVRLPGRLVRIKPLDLEKFLETHRG
jgi:excisionase family DNA binding protein